MKPVAENAPRRASAGTDDQHVGLDGVGFHAVRPALRV
jgi:hypothetical protein